VRVNIEERHKQKENLWNILFGLPPKLKDVLAHDIISRHSVFSLKVKVLVISLIKHIFEARMIK
jgi:hypothetical protein